MKDHIPVEVLLDRLVAHESLAPGMPLPPVGELAARLGKAESEIEGALQAAAAKGKLTLAPDGSAVVAVPAVRDGDQLFSFSVSAARHRQRLVTALLEAPAVRRPLADDTHPLYALEQRAQSGLGLAADQPFIAIVRVRHLHGKPLVLHRVYLDPGRFPADFASAHDFASESLIALYGAAGYRLQSRDTVLHARLTNLYEDNTLRALGQESHLQAVLHAEQRFHATRDGASEPFVLEYMQATYFDHWQYSIDNRPAGGRGS